MPWPKPSPCLQTPLPTGGKLGAAEVEPLAWLSPDALLDLRQALHRRCLYLLAMAASLLLILLPAGPASALSASGLPPQPPSDHVLDQADLLSRAAAAEIARALDGFVVDGVQASWISVPRLDYDLSLRQFGTDLLQRWDTTGETAGPDQQLLFLIDGQTSGTAIVASSELQDRLSPQLLSSTARTTLGQPLRDGGRYRQASLAAIDRLKTVLAGGEDPGPPAQPSATTVATASVPSREQTLSSNAFTWVVVLLVVGTVVPMLTWWVFSR